MGYLCVLTMFESFALNFSELLSCLRAAVRCFGRIGTEEVFLTPCGPLKNWLLKTLVAAFALLLAAYDV